MDLVTFTEEILDGKLFCAVAAIAKNRNRARFFSLSFPKFSETSFRENFCLANSVIDVLAVFLVY